MGRSVARAGGVREVLADLRAVADASRLDGMAFVGINVDRAWGVLVPNIRKLGRRLKRTAADRHALAAGLWASEVHEARMLAALVDDPDRVTATQMDAWAADFDSWDLCDQVCNNLFVHAAPAPKRAVAWARRRHGFTKRAGFVLMACRAVTDKAAKDRVFRDLLPLIEAGAEDERNEVKKGVNWALRQIGKRNKALNKAAIACGERMLAHGIETKNGTVRWIARDALRELKSDKIQGALRP